MDGSPKELVSKMRDHLREAAAIKDKLMEQGFTVNLCSEDIDGEFSFEWSHLVVARVKKTETTEL